MRVCNVAVCRLGCLSPWLPVVLAAWHECAQSILGHTGFKEIRGEHLTGSSLLVLLTTVVTALNEHGQVRIVDAWTAVVNRMAEEGLAQEMVPSCCNSGIVPEWLASLVERLCWLERLLARV